MKTFRILGKRGRITVPYEIRCKVGFKQNDVLSFEESKYNPFDDTLRIECEIDKPKGSEYFDYTPTEEEAKLIKDMIAEKIKSEYGQTLLEFCKDFQVDEQKMG